MADVQPLNGNQLLSDLSPEAVLFGKSLAIQDLKYKLVRICSSSVSVLLQGEIGVGKGVLSRFIHQRSSWLEGPYSRINCAVLPCSVGNLDLFDLPRLGTIEVEEEEHSDSGTLFFDHVSELNPQLQYQVSTALADRDLAKMLHQPSAEKSIRIISSSTRNLRQEVRIGRFRPELFYRMAVVTVDVPPLRNRIEDLPGLIEYFRLRYTSKTNAANRPFPDALVSRAMSYRWPGNIPELESFVCRCLLLGCNRCELEEDEPITGSERECESECALYKSHDADTWPPN